MRPGPTGRGRRWRPAAQQGGPDPARIVGRPRTKPAEPRRGVRRAGPGAPSAAGSSTARSVDGGGAHRGCPGSHDAAGASGVTARPTEAGRRRGAATSWRRRRRMPLRSSQAVLTMLDPGVGVLDPVDGHLVDAQPVALGQHQQLGVEEPAVVLNHRQQQPGHVGPQRLEAALGVGDPGAQGRPDDQVVAAGDHLALQAPRDPGARAPAGSRWPGRSARTAAAPPGAAGRRDRWTGRRPCRPPPAAELALQAVRKAWPRPWRRQWTASHAVQFGAQPLRRATRCRRCCRCRR